MKKLFFILLVVLSGFLLACSNATEKTEETVTDSLKADSLRSSEPAHGMGPMDTLGRRPRD